MSADRRAPLCPSEKVGTVRVPSSEAVGLVKRRGREPSRGKNWFIPNAAFRRATRKQGFGTWTKPISLQWSFLKELRGKQSVVLEPNCGGYADEEHGDCRVWEAGAVALRRGTVEVA